MDTKVQEKKLLVEKSKAKLGLHVQEEMFVQRREQLPVMIYNIHYLEDEVIPKKTSFSNQKVVENK